MTTMYTEDEKAIFYLDRGDGKGEIALDPQECYRTLSIALKGEPLGGEGGLLERIQRGDDWTVEDAAQKLYPAIQKAFDLSPLGDDGSGCTERMQWRVLCDFLHFLDGLKKKRAG